MLKCAHFHLSVESDWYPAKVLHRLTVALLCRKGVRISFHKAVSHRESSSSSTLQIRPEFRAS